MRMAVPVTMLVVSFVLALLLANIVLPERIDDLVFDLRRVDPTSYGGVGVFVIGGVLAPPRPFVTGALLGLLDGVLWSLLFVVAPGTTMRGTTTGTMTVRTLQLSDVAAILVIAVIVGAIVTGISGWVANSI